MADDAKLLAVIDANTKAFENALKRVEGQTNRTFNNADRSVKRLNTSLNASALSAAKFGRSLGLAFSGAAAIALAARTIRLFIDNTIESEKAVAQLNATLKSTGGAAGLSSAELQDLASQLQKVTVFGDEAIIGVESLLLIFDKIGKDVFPDAVEAVLNMSTVLGTDLNSSARLVGKALQDPVKALGALRKAGVDFSPAQEKIIKNLQKTGDLARAQTLILDRMNTKMGESAKAARETLGGALLALSEAWGDLFEASGPASDKLRLAIENLTKAISDPLFKEAVATIGVGLVGAIQALIDILPKISNPIEQFNRDVADMSAKAQDKIQTILDAVESAGRFTGIVPLSERLGVTDFALKQIDKAHSAVDRHVEDAELLAALQKKFTIAPGTPAPTGGPGIVGFDPDAIDEAAAAEEALAAQLEAEAEAQRIAEQARKAAADELIRNKQAVLDLISDLEFERSLIGLSNEQRQVEIELRRAGAAATGDQQKEIAALVLAGLAEQKALDTLIDRMDEIRSAAGGALSAFNDALRNGEGLAGGLKSALESVLDVVIRIAEQKAIEALLGGIGTSGGGGSGGLLGSILSGLLGGGRSSSAAATSFTSLATPTAAGMRSAAASRQAPTVVQLVVGPGQLFEPTVAGISGAVAVQAVRQNNRGLPAMISDRRARGI